MYKRRSEWESDPEDCKDADDDHGSTRRCSRRRRSSGGSRCCGPLVNIQPSDISAHSLRAGGATALLRAKVDPTEIQLVGRWRSWAMIRYLHKTALDTGLYANRMLNAGQFIIQEHSRLPADVLKTLEAHPPSTTYPPNDVGVETTPWCVAESIIG